MYILHYTVTTSISNTVYRIYIWYLFNIYIYIHIIYILWKLPGLRAFLQCRCQVVKVAPGYGVATRLVSDLQPHCAAQALGLFHAVENLWQNRKLHLVQSAKNRQDQRGGFFHAFPRPMPIPAAGVSWQKSGGKLQSARHAVRTLEPVMTFSEVSTSWVDCCSLVMTSSFDCDPSEWLEWIPSHQLSWKCSGLVKILYSLETIAWWKKSVQNTYV